MMIQNFDHSYQVMRCLGGTETTEEFLCTELEAGRQSARLLVRVADPALAKSFTLFLEEKARSRKFTDYLECFQADGYCCAVFSCSLDQGLLERLESERAGLKERAEIAKGLLERLLLLEPHPYLAIQALRPEQITVSRSLEVRWNYHLEGMGQFERYTRADISRSLVSILRVLFAQEEAKRLYPKLEAYLQGLEEDGDFSYLELYERFWPVYQELLGEQKEAPVPKTFLFRLWERMKKFLGICRKLLAFLILGAAVWYVIQVFQDDSGSQVVQETFQQIGDLPIEQQEAGE